MKLVEALRARAQEMERLGIFDIGSNGAEPAEYLALCDQIDHQAAALKEAFQLLNSTLRGEIPGPTRSAIVKFLIEHGCYEPHYD